MVDGWDAWREEHSGGHNRHANSGTVNHVNGRIGRIVRFDGKKALTNSTVDRPEEVPSKDQASPFLRQRTLYAPARLSRPTRTT